MDAATIDSARRGDRKAQALLLSALQDVWFRFCVSLLRDGERARDATQETALRFLEQLPRFRGDSQLKTWSLGIALNVVREMRRKRSIETLETDIAANMQSSRPEIETNEEKQMLRRNLDTLPDRQREALVLRFFEEMSTEETASAMGCAVGTVKATVHQALRAMRAKLTQTS